ncbi:IS1595 family transposase [Rhodovulum adriaticum]|uniref:Transposase-like zinc ribbon protein n=1 Tax=Rhodovulum adriaticum TaxID=35804 RepID=A0A4R2NWM7_RHOAD|nr:IS1595 family transposase [Rhodovulum adriaticum]TCP26490.1 transposase-like zinc ribbon protein [Rhodovulum adriaticum]
MKQTNVRQFFAQFPNDEACLAHLFNVRFGQGYVCPKCEREAKWYPLTNEKAYSCQWCGHHIHPMVGSIFEKSRTPLQLWFYAIFLFTTSRHGVSAKELQRQLGVTYKTAWRMAALIREHMAAIDGDEPLGSDGEVVEIDEAYVGGEKKNSYGQRDKTIVLGMVERGGDALVKVVPNMKGETVSKVVAKNVAPGAEIHADMHVSYDQLRKQGFDLKRINKKALGAYVGPNGETVNAIENFWRHLKCSIEGTHISVSPKYLERYAKEFEYRFNRRMRPETMLSELLSRFPELDA